MESEKGLSSYLLQYAYEAAPFVWLNVKCSTGVDMEYDSKTAAVRAMKTLRLEESSREDSVKYPSDIYD